MQGTTSASEYVKNAKTVLPSPGLRARLSRGESNSYAGRLRVAAHSNGQFFGADDFQLIRKSW